MKNVAHSVRERLLNRARATGLPHEYLLVRYALERFLYRMSVSPHAGRFLLKGALLFTVWGRDDHRPTRDADLLGSGPGEIKNLESAFRDICAVACDDGIIFNPNSVRGERIAEDKVYTGVRVLLEAELAKAIAATFERRRTEIPGGTPVALTPAFAESATRKRHWEGFVRRNRLPADRVTFEQTQAVIAGLVIPALKLARIAPR